jgi:uncharacterized protein YndB with AHSA1/START domain
VGQAPDTCSLRLTRRYPAAPAEVWAVLTEPASLSRWLAPAEAVELEAGGRFRVGRVDARVREVEPEQVLELDWRHPDEEPSVVRFELTRDGDGTRVVLDHIRVEAPVGMAYISRWTVSLGRLDALLGGVR